MVALLHSNLVANSFEGNSEFLISSTLFQSNLLLLFILESPLRVCPKGFLFLISFCGE
jgi:hypothetical protein